MKRSLRFLRVDAWAGRRFEDAERGIALLIVISVLTVIGIMGVAFAFSMHLETQATRQFVSTTQARYLAESGVAHARALLDEDRFGSRIDDGSEAWSRDGAGSEADVDGDGSPESRWWPVRDATDAVVGRYAMKVTDEASKVNLNAARAEGALTGAGAPNLTTLLAELGVRDAQQAAEAIETYRYGQDGRPGKAGIDDDGDGAIDGPDEYQPLALLGDDRRLEGLEELRAIAGLDAPTIRKLSQVATVYSWDLNVTVTGKPRVNVNSATAEELLQVLLEAGVADPWQAAVNMADYVDADVEFSHVTKAAQFLAIPNEGPRGSWSRRETPEGHYASESPGGDALVWSVAVPTGSFRILARGLDGRCIGDMGIGGQQRSSVDDGESLGVFNLSGTLTLSVTNREAAGTSCAFRGIELVSESAKTGVMVRGIEAVRFNELMVDPTVTFDIADATFDAQGSDWACPEGSALCSNGGKGQARWSWTSKVLQPGRYHLRVFGSGPGQTVGEVRIDGVAQLLVHGERHPSTVLVGSDGKISVTIGKTADSGTYYLKGISLSVQPDGEYVELINLSDRSIDVGGWTIEGELTGGQQAKLPVGARLAPHGLLVAAVDLDDADGKPSAALSGNGIDARTAWEIPREANAVQLEFPGGAPSADTDWLKTALPSGTTRRLILRSGGATVDEVQYPASLPKTPFQSLEKGDPAVVTDADQDGIDEGWYASLKLYTPGTANDNEGLKETRDLKTLVHDPLKEVLVLNRPLTGVGELAGFASGKAWKPFSSTDLAKIVDRFTVEGYRLEAEGHAVGSSGQSAWLEQADGYALHTDPKQAEVAGAWQWSDIPDGSYRLSLYSCAGCAGEQMAIRWQRADQSWTEWSPPLSTDTQGRLTIGQLTVGMSNGTPAQTLMLEAMCASPSGICHVDYIRLDPQLLRIGPVNINTAPTEVLLALPGITEATVSRIMAGRPYGNQGEKGQGIGDVLAGNVLGATDEDKLALFRQLGHLLTVRSDVFEILSLGQGIENDRPDATQRIQTVIQR